MLILQFFIVFVSYCNSIFLEYMAPLNHLIYSFFHHNYLARIMQLDQLHNIIYLKKHLYSIHNYNFSFFNFPLLTKFRNFNCYVSLLIWLNSYSILTDDRALCDKIHRTLKLFSNLIFSWYLMYTFHYRAILYHFYPIARFVIAPLHILLPYRPVHFIIYRTTRQSDTVARAQAVGENPVRDAIPYPVVSLSG